MSLTLFAGIRFLRSSFSTTFTSNLLKHRYYIVQYTIYCNQMDAKVEAIPIVDIDDEGRFKSILNKVYGKEQADGNEPNKLIVPGYKRAQWHADIYDEVSGSICVLGLDTECLDGGRIEHFPESKLLKVYSYTTIKYLLDDGCYGIEDNLKFLANNNREEL